MATTRLTFHTEIAKSYRAARVASRLDDGRRAALACELVFETPPSVDEDWRVGLIVGPSGSGKTSAARALYDAALDWRPEWRDDRPIVDEFAEVDFDRLDAALAAVGFGSPVRQLQRYSTLSVGERFRCDLARTLLEAPGEVAVVDEFANALDRAVALAAAATTRKALDRGVFGARKLVAVACRDDVAEPLEPDWTLDMASGKLARGRLRRRSLRFAIREGAASLWRDYRAFHYLSGALNRASSCLVATLEEEDGTAFDVAFCALLPCEGRRGRRRVHRLVVRPEFQGLGIGGAFLDALGALERSRGFGLEIVVGTPFFVRRLARSPVWRLRNVYPHGRRQRSHGKRAGGSFGRAVASFEYVGG